MPEEPRSRTLTEADAAELLRLTTDLDTVWHATTTTNEERKRIISTAVTKVVLHDSGTEALEVEIIWAGGLSERKRLLKGPGGAQLIKKMAVEGHSKSDILTTVTELGLTTGRGKLLTPKALTRKVWGLGVGMKEPRLEALRRIRQMLIECRSQREILHALRTYGPQPEEGEWNPGRLTTAINTLQEGAWGQAVAPIPPGTPSFRRLELPAIQLFAQRRREGWFFRQIARELNALGFRTPRGHAFTAQNAYTVYEYLRKDPTLAALFAFEASRGRRSRRRKRRSEPPR